MSTLVKRINKDGEVVSEKTLEKEQEKKPRAKRKYTKKTK